MGSNGQAQVARIIRRVVYRQMTISLASVDWYERLTRATIRGGWEVIRADGALMQLERPRVRLP